MSPSGQTPFRISFLEVLTLLPPYNPHRYNQLNSRESFSFIGPHAQDPIVEHLEVLARKSFNTTLICLVYESEEGCPDDLRWYANGRPLRNSGKYEILEKKTQSKCKREFRLTIFNVTKNDEGNYSCHWICEYFDDKIATIKLKVSVESITGKSFHVSLLSSVS